MDISILVGKTLINILESKDEIIFVVSDNEQYKLYHDQDCCEYVEVEDIVGDLQDLIDSPILKAEEVRGERNVNPDGVPDKVYQDSFTWTFYHFATLKGYVTIRWYGESNGYYSESVDFTQLGKSKWED